MTNSKEVSCIKEERQLENSSVCSTHGALIITENFLISKRIKSYKKVKCRMHLFVLNCPTENQNQTLKVLF